MKDHAVITGTFSDVKFVKTRSAMQIIIEVPIEAADATLAVLGGVPKWGSEVHVAVARLNTHEEPKAKRGSLAQQAGILCDDPVFVTFMAERYKAYGDTAQRIRELCEVTSRAEFDTDELAGNRWKEMVREYQAWKLL